VVTLVTYPASGGQPVARDVTKCFRLDAAAWGTVQLPRLGIEAPGPPSASLGPRCTGTFPLVTAGYGVRRHGVGGSGGRNHGAVTLTKDAPVRGSRGGPTPGPRSLS
jgi:hypothetical protein